MTMQLDTTEVAGAFDGTIIDSPERWLVALDDAIVDALADAGRRLAGRPLASITVADAPITGIDEVAEQILQTVSATGPGFALVERFPVRELDEDEVRTMYWVFGLHLGRPVTQNRAASLVGDVRLTTTGGYRGYNTSKGGGFHCDFTHLGGLLSRRRARAGGSSSIASAAYIHNRLVAEAPALAAACYEPIALGRLREEDPDEAPFSVQPIIARDADRFGMFYNAALIKQAAEYPEAPAVTDRQTEACAAIEDITHRPGATFEYLLEEGQLLLFNNHRVLHSRSSFDDNDEPDERRHLLRLWLEVERLGAEVPDAVEYEYRFGRTGLGPEEI